MYLSRFVYNNFMLFLFLNKEQYHHNSLQLLYKKILLIDSLVELQIFNSPDTGDMVRSYLMAY